MPVSLVNADSLLSVDVGTVTTRAALFDVVEGNYRFIASGQSLTTGVAPYRDVSEGVRLAIEKLETITGRKFLGEGYQLIIPSSNGSGVDTFTATHSAGPAIKTAVVALLEDVSLESTRRLAHSTYTRVVETIGLNDTRKPEELIDSLVNIHPDLILFAGGTDGGAARSVQRLIETVGLACYLLPADKRPALLYAGNQDLGDEVRRTLQPLTSAFGIGSNLRPGIDIEDLQPAHNALVDLYNHVRGFQMRGLDELNVWAANTLVPTATAEGRVIRFLSTVYDASKGILGLDLGASAITIAAAFSGKLTLGVYPQFGLGEGLSELLRYTRVEDILKWIPVEIPVAAISEYLYQKSLHPSSLPATLEDLAIEQAVACQGLHVALDIAGRDFPRNIQRAALRLTPYFDPILAAGSVITRAPTLGQGLLLLLDAVQPVGITNIILDQNSLLPALGAASIRNSVLPIQILESGAFLGMATVVAPFVNARLDTPVLKVRLINRNGNENQVEVKQGDLVVIPLPVGQSGRLFLEPLNHADLGFGTRPPSLDGIQVNGTAMGIVIDARGRPLRLPSDHDKRRELIKKWLWTLGG